MSKIKIAIIEDSKELCDIFTNHINKHYSEEVEIVGIANDGKEGLDLLVETKPNIALIDIMLPVLDGIAILEKLNSLYLIDKICCIVLSGVNIEAISNKALSLGAKYYILKPYNSIDLVKRIIQVYKDNLHHTMIPNQPVINHESKPFGNEDMHKILNEKPEIFATYLLQLIGVPPNLTGYYYLRSAIVHCIEDKKLLDGITKSLYPTIAKQFNTTGQRVERSIRHAIQKTWENGCEENYYNLLNRKAPGEKSRPSNSIFIMEIVDYYTLYNS